MFNFRKVIKDNKDTNADDNAQEKHENNESHNNLKKQNDEIELSLSEFVDKKREFESTLADKEITSEHTLLCGILTQQLEIDKNESVKCFVEKLSNKYFTKSFDELLDDLNFVVPIYNEDYTDKIHILEAIELNSEEAEILISHLFDSFKSKYSDPTFGEIEDKVSIYLPSEFQDKLEGMFFKEFWFYTLLEDCPEFASKEKVIDYLSWHLTKRIDEQVETFNNKYYPIYSSGRWGIVSSKKGFVNCDLCVQVNDIIVPVHDYLLYAFDLNIDQVNQNKQIKSDEIVDKLNEQILNLVCFVIADITKGFSTKITSDHFIFKELCLKFECNYEKVDELLSMHYSKDYSEEDVEKINDEIENIKRHTSVFNNLKDSLYEFMIQFIPLEKTVTSYTNEVNQIASRYPFITSSSESTKWNLLDAYKNRRDLTEAFRSFEEEKNKIIIIKETDDFLDFEYADWMQNENIRYFGRNKQNDEKEYLGYYHNLQLFRLPKLVVWDEEDSLIWEIADKNRSNYENRVFTLTPEQKSNFENLKQNLLSMIENKSNNKVIINDLSIRKSENLYVYHDVSVFGSDFDVAMIDSDELTSEVEIAMANERILVKQLENLNINVANKAERYQLASTQMENPELYKNEDFDLPFECYWDTSVSGDLDDLLFVVSFMIWTNKGLYVGQYANDSGMSFEDKVYNGRDFIGGLEPI